MTHSASQQPPDSHFSAAREEDPCLQIQVDLSAMLDGELDPASVRRVTVHSDICPACRQFLDGIRQQVRVHRRFSSAMSPAGVGAFAQVGGSAPGAGHSGEGHADGTSAVLRRQLTVNQRKLSRILYELGRNFALMGLSPDFSREVAREPVPVPDVAMRGRNLLDEVSRNDAAAGPEWVAAKDLFDGGLRSPDENLARGQRLLTECLALDPSSDDARIYLGLVHYARGQRSLARKQFQRVLEGTADVVMRGYALTSLSNIHLDEGDCDGAIDLLMDLVDSGVWDTNPGNGKARGSAAPDTCVRGQPRLFAALFNLALAHGLKGGFTESRQWFERLHAEAPHRRRWVAQELSRRSHFLHLVHTRPDARPLAEALPTWFPTTAARAEGPAFGS